MIQFVWLGGFLLLFAVVVSTAAVIAVAIRASARGYASALVSGIVAGFACVAVYLEGAGSTLLYAGLVVTAINLALYYFVLKPASDWKQRKYGREVARLAAIHLILVIGSALFTLPFAWLVVTSLKEDEDMSRFPPVWIPRQQVKVMVDGQSCGLAYAMYKGQRVKVATLKELESGERVLKVLEPASLQGKVFELPRAEVEKVKVFGPVWKNYPDALKFLPEETNRGLAFLWNTMFLASMTVLGTLISGSLVAFSFARLRWPGRDGLFVVLLATMMLPRAVTMMPIFLIFREIGWIDSLRPLWFPAFLGSTARSAFYIFLMRQFFLTIPNDLEDAARIDGCSFFGIFWRIMLPLIKPALAAVTIMTFMEAWNDFMGPLIYVSSPLRMPLSYALGLFQTAHGGEPGLLMAAAVMMIIPVLMLFFFTQRYFIQGVTLTGIKG